MLRTRLIQETGFTDLLNLIKIDEAMSIKGIIMVDMVRGLRLNGTGGVKKGPKKLIKTPKIPASNSKMNPVFAFAML